MAKPSKEWIVAQVDRMLAVANDRHPEFLSDCLSKPYDIANHWDTDIDMTIVKDDSQHRYDTHHTNGSDDERVSGFCVPQHKTDDGKAQITVYKSGFYPRDCFTILHELGHHLQHSDTKLFCALRVFNDKASAKYAEEAACDMFASKALMPDCVIPELENHDWTAQSVEDLFRRTQASRPASTRRIAALLKPGSWITYIGKEGDPQLRAFSDGHTLYDVELLPIEHVALEEYKKPRTKKQRFGTHDHPERSFLIEDPNNPHIPEEPLSEGIRVSVTTSPMQDYGDRCMFIMVGC